jgi:hypothetical protein
MLSWSSTAAGTPADIGAIADDGLDAGLPFSTELVAFAQAIGGWDDAALSAARSVLAAAAGEAFMIDAAAVVANFEMMTREADGTGARFAPETAAPRAAAAQQLGIQGFTSAR